MSQALSNSLNPPYHTRSQKHKYLQAQARARELEEVPRLAGGMPRMVHHIWLGGRAMPARFIEYRDAWIRAWPKWKFVLWNEENLPADLPLSDLIERGENMGEKSDVARIALVARFGGLYLDLDVAPLQPQVLAARLKRVSALATQARTGWWKDETQGNPRLIENAVIGGAPAHPFWQFVERELRRNFEDDFLGWRQMAPGFGRTLHRTGPRFLQRCVEEWASQGHKGAQAPTLWDEQRCPHLGHTEWQEGVVLPETALLVHASSSSWLT